MSSVDLTELRRFIDRPRVEQRAAVRWRVVELSAARDAAAAASDARTLREVVLMVDELRPLYPEFAPELDRIGARARDDLKRFGPAEAATLRQAESVRDAAAARRAGSGDSLRALHGGIRVTTTFDLPGTEVTEHLCEVFGLVVTSRAAFPAAGAEPQSVIGGELRTMTHLLEASRETAIERMVEHARTVAADAVVGVRFDSAALADGWAEICAYGTAVKLRPCRVTACRRLGRPPL